MRWLFSPLLLLAAPVTAQDAPVPAPAVPEAQLPFAVDETRMTVPVQIAGAGPYRFVIDTGAQRTVISRELAGTLGLARGPDVRLTSMTETSTAGTVIIPALSVSSLATTRIEAPTFDGVNLGAAGMLGIDTLQGHAVSIDFDRRTMAVLRSDRRTRHEDRLPNEIVVRAKSLYGQLVVTDATCDGLKVRVILDTGTPDSIGNPALQQKLLRRRQAMTPVSFTSVTGGIMVGQASLISRITISGLTISQLPIAYADAAPFRRFGLGNTPAIMLGMDALRLFRRVQIDFANRELRLALPRDVARTDPGTMSLPVG